MKQTHMQTLYVLNASDLDRVDAAVLLLKQVLEDIIESRQIRVPTEPNSPGSLYELEEMAAQKSDERKTRDDEF
jgi:hypothetical protein